MDFEIKDVKSNKQQQQQQYKQNVKCYQKLIKKRW